MEKQVIKHTAIVQTVHSDSVVVRVQQTSACAHCTAAKFCTAAESREHLLEVPVSVGHSYTPGQEVSLLAQSYLGWEAIVWAFVLPLLLFVGGVILLYSVLGLPDWCAALGAAGGLCLYGGLLYLLRKQMSRRFVFELEPSSDVP